MLQNLSASITTQKNFCFREGAKFKSEVVNASRAHFLQKYPRQVEERSVNIAEVR